MPKPFKAVERVPLATDEAKIAAKIMQGFFTGVGVFQGEDILDEIMDVLICVYEADNAGLELYADVQMWMEAWNDKSIARGSDASISNGFRSRTVPASALKIDRPKATARAATESLSA